MHACCATQSDPTNAAIDKSLDEQEKKLDSQVRLLLLGASDSGKSTVAKQMTILHKGGHSDDEKIQIYSHSPI